MNRGTVLAALVAALLLMAWLGLASYGATGEGGLVSVGRIVVVVLLGYLVFQGRRWASFLLSLWFGLTALVFVAAAGAVGGLGRIVVSLAFAAVFLGAAVVLWRTRTRGLAPAAGAEEDGPAAP